MNASRVDCLARAVRFLLFVMIPSPDWLSCCVLLPPPLLDYKRLHLPGLHPGRLPANVYSEYSKYKTTAFSCLCTEIMRRRFLRVFCPWKQMENNPLRYLLLPLHAGLNSVQGGGGGTKMSSSLRGGLQRKWRQDNAAWKYEGRGLFVFNHSLLQFIRKYKVARHTSTMSQMLGL